MINNKANGFTNLYFQEKKISELESSLKESSKFGQVMANFNSLQAGKAFKAFL